MTPFDTILHRQLDKRKQAGNHRTLSVPNGLIDFCSNDYLGLARSSELKQAIDLALQNSELLLKNGSTGSRLITGNSAYAESVEQQLARLFKSEATLVFGSGYLANLAILSSLPQKGDIVLYDEHAHASIKDGLRLSHAQRFAYRHNDLNDLEKKLKRYPAARWIVTESIFSMDGDVCPLQPLADLAQQHNAHVILDEAHSTGILGPDGAGLAVANQVHQKIIARIHTFGKGVGVHGACVAGSSTLKSYLINFARPFIYTTGPSPHSWASIEAAFVWIALHPHLQQQLSEKIGLFRDGAKGNDAISPIVSVAAPGNDHAKQAAKKLQQAGFDVRPILSPTVKAGSERLRICIHAFNSEKEIRDLTTLLKKENLL